MFESNEQTWVSWQPLTSSNPLLDCCRRWLLGTAAEIQKFRVLTTVSLCKSQSATRSRLLIFSWHLDGSSVHSYPDYDDDPTFVNTVRLLEVRIRFLLWVGRQRVNRINPTALSHHWCPTQLDWVNSHFDQVAKLRVISSRLSIPCSDSVLYTTKTLHY